MKKIIAKSTLLLASFLMTMVFVLPSAAMAQDGTTTVDDSAIENSVGDAPERKSVQFDQPKATSGETTTGYTKDGKPVSQEELQKIRDDMDKGIIEKQPVLSALVILAILGAIFYFAFYRKKLASKKLAKK